MKEAKRIIDEANISKVSVAKFLGVSRQMLYNYLSLDSISDLPSDKQGKLLDLFGVEKEADLKKIKVDERYISSIESRMSDLTEADRAIVQAELDKLITKYNNFVNSINVEFEESISVTNKWLFGAVVSSISLLSVAAFFFKRRLPL